MSLQPGASLLETITGGDAPGLSNFNVYNGSNLVCQITEVPSTGVPITVTNTTDGYTLNTSAASIPIVGTFSDSDQTIYTGMTNIV